MFTEASPNPLPTAPGLPRGPGGRTWVMGVLNLTPDSFSDGGDFPDTSAALGHAATMRRVGADIVDVGGESTRPGAQRPSLTQERARILPVVSALAASGAVVSVDTMRAELARDAVKAGAALINDVSGGLADPAMLETVAELGVPFVAMHWRAHADRMARLTTYSDVVEEVVEHLAQRLAAAREAGISDVILDPGLGFAKEAEHNWALLAALPSLQELGAPLLLGASRKRFLGALLHRADPRERDDATTAISALAAAQGVWAVRVHAVQPSADAVRIAAAWAAADRGRRGDRWGFATCGDPDQAPRRG